MPDEACGAAGGAWGGARCGGLAAAAGALDGLPREKKPPPPLPPLDPELERPPPKRNIGKFNDSFFMLLF